MVCAAFSNSDYNVLYAQDIFCVGNKNVIFGNDGVINLNYVECKELLFSANNECMQIFITANTGNQCLKCFVTRYHDNFTSCILKANEL